MWTASRLDVPARSVGLLARLAYGVTALAVLAALVLTGGSAARAANASFVPEASSATWDGGLVTVTFAEAGLPPGASTTVEVEATLAVDTLCRLNGMVLLSTRSSGTVVDESEYRADAEGIVTGARELPLVVRPPTTAGLPCVAEVTRTLRVTLRDLTTGAVLIRSALV